MCLCACQWCRNKTGVGGDLPLRKDSVGARISFCPLSFHMKCDSSQSTKNGRGTERETNDKSLFMRVT